MTGSAPYRLFDTRVLRVARLSPTFIRVTLGGRSLRWFAPWGLDQRIKLVLPRADGGWGDALAGEVDGLGVPEWRRLVAQEPAGARHPLRTYTPRAVRPEAREVDIDFFVHEPAGPASTWAAGAEAGDRLLLSGPDVRAQDRRHGIQWRPARPPARVLLVGDETAVPALAGIGAALPRTTTGTVLVEADDPLACPALGDLPEDVEVRLLARGGRRPGTALAEAIARWARDDSGAAAATGRDFTAWIAAESTAVAALRDAVTAHGVDPALVQAQGYWRVGRRDAPSEGILTHR